MSDCGVSQIAHTTVSFWLDITVYADTVLLNKA
jgi:hypothetical protein